MKQANKRFYRKYFILFFLFRKSSQYHQGN